MESDAGLGGSRESVLGQLNDQLSVALDLSDTVDEFLVSAQIALALDAVRGALAGPGGVLKEAGVSAG